MSSLCWVSAFVFGLFCLQVFGQVGETSSFRTETTAPSTMDGEKVLAYYSVKSYQKMATSCSAKSIIGSGHCSITCETGNAICEGGLISVSCKCGTLSRTKPDFVQSASNYLDTFAGFCAGSSSSGVQGMSQKINAVNSTWVVGTNQQFHDAENDAYSYWNALSASDRAIIQAWLDANPLQ